MASNAPVEVASILQSASINRHPSPAHDINPSTAASAKHPVRLSSHHGPDDFSEAAEDEIPLSVLRPVPRQSTMPPLPDLRFEQSYLKRIEKAESWQAVAWITFQDHVSYPIWTSIISPCLTGQTGRHVFRSGCLVDPGIERLASSESIIQVRWKKCGCEIEAVVVGGEQLANPHRAFWTAP